MARSQRGANRRHDAVDLNNGSIGLVIMAELVQFVQRHHLIAGESLAPSTIATLEPLQLNKGTITHIPGIRKKKMHQRVANTIRRTKTTIARNPIIAQSLDTGQPRDCGISGSREMMARKDVRLL